MRSKDLEGFGPVGTNGPEMTTVSKSVLDELVALALECAEDLEAHIDAEYQSRDTQPVQARRHARDMEIVRKVRSVTNRLHPANR